MAAKLSPIFFAAGLALASAFSFAEIRVNDDLGREIVLDSPARRIVSLAPHNTENLFTAGAGKFTVGTVDFSDFPPEALEIPHVGGYKKINSEAVLGAKPDLVIAWASGNSTAQVQRLIDLGLTVFYSEPDTFERIISNIARFSVLAGTEQTAAPRIDKMRAIHTSLKQQYSGQVPVKVFYQVWNQPLITLNGKHSVSHAISICGGMNIFKDEPTIAPRINTEGVVERNPEIILLAGHSENQASGWKEMWQKWPAIQAVKDEAIFYIDADVVSRPTERFIEGARNICQIINQTRQSITKP